MKKKFLFISCDDAKHICDKAQYGEATSWERFQLKFRLAWCSLTRGYSKTNTKLTKAMENAKVNCLEKNERLKIQKEFEKELTKHQ